jgi:hypothetical protein
MLISQTIDQKDLSIEPLRSILESASRTNQKVFVEDFTATDWCPYCGTGSLAMSVLLDDFPETLITIQWQVDSDAFNQDDCQYDSQGNCVDLRGELYGLSFTFPNGTTVQLNFSDYEFGEYGMYTDLDHSCTEEMWDGDFFVFASWDPIYLTEKEKEDITLLYETEPGTLPNWSP